MLTLFKCKSNRNYLIVGIKEDCYFSIKRRLLDLGFTQGQRVCKVKSSLLNKVVLVEIRGYLLSLKSKIADYILVEER